MIARDASFWRDRRVFVTGGTGLVGKWLSEELAGLGSKVAVLSRNRSATVAAPVSLFRVPGGLSDFDGLRRALDAHGAQVVFHLGAQTQVTAAKADPLSTFEVNVRGSWQLLEAARQSGAGQVVTMSSGKVYGTSPEPVAEDSPVHGKDPYAVSKTCADLIARTYSQTYGLPVAVTRWTNIFGGGDPNSGRLIPQLIGATERGERLVLRSTGRALRDYLYVRDAVDGLLRTAEQLARRVELSGETFNFSSGRRATVFEVAAIVQRLMGSPELRPTCAADASEETSDAAIGSEKARNILGWEPRFSLEEGLEETVYQRAAAPAGRGAA